MKKFVLLMTAFALSCSCTEKMPKDFPAFLTGSWKLVNAAIPYSTKNDYTSDNVVFVFKPDGTLTVSGNISYDVDVPIYQSPLYESYVKNKHQLTPGTHTFSFLEPMPGGDPGIMIGDAEYMALSYDLSGDKITLLYYNFFYMLSKIK